MDFLKTSSIVTDFWDLLFYPLLLFTLCAFEFKLIIGRESFNGVISAITTKAQQYIQRIKQYDQLYKALPVIIVFILFSFLHLFDIIISWTERVLCLGFTFQHDSILEEKVVLNVWKYYPNIEDVYTLQNIVSYKAKQNGLGTSKILSSEGVSALPELLIRSLFSFTVILVILSFLSLLVLVFRKTIKGNKKITCGRIMKRLKTVLYSFISLVLTILVLFLISFLNRYHADDYIVEKWTQCEMELISSGAPPESDIEIETIKHQEVSEWIEHLHDRTRFYLDVGSSSYSINISDEGISFEKGRISRIY